MTVERLPNSENFDEVYPSDSEDDDVDNSAEDEADPENDRFKALVKKGRDIDEQLAKANEEMNVGATQMSILTSFAKSMDVRRPDDLSAFMSNHRLERKKAYELVFDSDQRVKALERQRHRNQRELAKIKKALKKAGLKAMKLKAKENKRKQRVRDEQEAVKRLLKEERIQFWPRKVYRVVVSLDTNSSFTPASSRQGSIDTVGKPVSRDSYVGECDIALSVSYITYCAAWTPRYDLSLSTMNKTGLIIYRAQLYNTTSETWKDAKVTLSTSQTDFQGLRESIPSMVPWHIKLHKKIKGTSDTANSALLSHHEKAYKGIAIPSSNQYDVQRAELFGVGPTLQTHGKKMYNDWPVRVQNLYSLPPPPMQAQQKAPQMAQMAAVQQQQMAHAQQQQIAQVQQQQMAQVKHSTGARSESVNGGHEEGGEIAEGFSFADWDADTGTMTHSLPALATQESAWSESGLTATYDIPGLRTIAPSHTARRQKIASINLKNTGFSYLVVPKLRDAAFLKARIYNTSSISLLRGPCGVTLDGSFLGNTALPRCSAGDFFRLNLGVDPSVSVIYSKPVLKRNQTGVFQKEGSSIYTRTCTIINTNRKRVLEGVVIDQIPVSDDERTRVEILQPKGLCHEGDTGNAGVAFPDVGNMLDTWGKATASLEKNGEIWWAVVIEPGRGAQLVLEYEVKCPTTDVVVEV